MAGLAFIMGDLAGYTYLAGIWKETPHDLLWEVDHSVYADIFSGESHVECGYQAPSWSWAFIPTPIFAAAGMKSQLDPEMISRSSMPRCRQPAKFMMDTSRSMDIISG